MSRKRKLFPRTLAECIEPVAAPVLKERGLAQANIVRHWETIVGPELAAHATPHRLSHRTDGGGTLIVHTTGAFALELQHMEPLILERIATYFGYRAVTRLKIEQVRSRSGSGLSAGALAKAEAAAHGKIEPDKEAMRQKLRTLAESLQNEPG